MKRELKGQYISITTDHWTSNKTKNCAVLTAHWVEGRKFKSCMLHFEHHSGRTRVEDIGREFSQIFEDYGFDLSYIVSDTTDTTGNMNKFGCYLQIKGVIYIYCADHNIHICAKLAYKEENILDLENIMKSARSLIEHFSSSTQASDKLLAMQKIIIPSEVPNKLIRDVATRWWYIWCMLKRISELFAPIDALIASDQVQVRNLTEAQKVIVIEIEKALLRMATSQRFLEGQNYATTSLVPFCLWKIMNTLRETEESNEVSP